MDPHPALLLLLVYGVTSFELTIQPSSLLVKDRTNVTVMCRSTDELADCQFNWWDLDEEHASILKFDFHEGMESDVAYLVNGSEVNWRLAGYRYVGNGLKAGHCGIELIGLKDVRYRMLSCRARQLGKGWKYAYMTIRGNVSTELGFSPAGQMAVVAPGNSLAILSWTERPVRIRSCSFRFPGKNQICFGEIIPRNATRPVNHNPRRGNNTNRLRPESVSRSTTPCGSGTSFRNSNTWSYHGASSSQCGIMLRNVTEHQDGLVFFEAWTEAGGYDRRVFHLTVAEAPHGTNLHAPTLPVKENEDFFVTCTVNKSRPVANITWYMEDEVLRQDSLDDSSEDNQNDSPWRWANGKYPLSQTVVLKARRKLHGQQIKCVVTHVGLPEPVVLKQVISIADSEIRDSCPPVQPSSGVLQECKLGNRPVNCSRPAAFGTRLKIILQCRDGSPSTQTIIECLNTGFWDTPLPKCKPDSETRNFCPPVPPSSGVLQECKLGNRPVNCSRPAAFGTQLRMTLQCRDGSPSTQTTIACLNTGLWDTTPPRCKLGCGTVRSGVQTIPTSDQSLVQGQFPWHVAIYQLKEGKYEQVCSGSLLSMTTILTAATCFVSHVRDVHSFNSSLYKVAAAKLHRSWDIKDEHVQLRPVAALSANQHFLGESTSFNLNLAVLTVTEPFQQTENVSPVCIDWNIAPSKHNQFLSQKEGYVPGWGFVEEEVQSSVLKSVTLPYVDYEACHSLLEPYARTYLTADTFCAGSTHHHHGYTVCNTDQGAGLVFLHPHTNKYHLHGVASVTFKPSSNKETCYPSSLLNFATFYGYLEWIQELAT